MDVFGSVDEDAPAIPSNSSCALVARRETFLREKVRCRAEEHRWKFTS